MTPKKRGLGKGLSDLGLGALIGDLKVEPTAVSEVEIIAPESLVSEPSPIDGQLKKLPMDVLKPGKYQPRKHISQEALEELANSIRSQGVIQPIVVRPIENHLYEIIAGERRWRAAQLAGLSYIPAIIRDIDDEATMLMALIENIQRRDLNVVEEANALNRLMNEFNLTHQEVADAVGKSRTNVTNILRLLNLNPSVRALLENGQIEMGHARALLTLSESAQSEAANMIVTRGLSVRETEDLARRMMSHGSATAESKPGKMVMHDLQDQLSRHLSANVSVTQTAKGNGKVVIAYKNESQLNQILSKMTE
jgi:ParB family chromosome partitioning protein